MTTHTLRCWLVASFCLAASTAFAQSDPAPASADAATKPAVTQTHPTARSPKKQRADTKAPASGVSLLKSDEAEKASRLAEGRKKFFESSSGFNSDGRSTPMSIGNDGRPAMGFKF